MCIVYAHAFESNFFINYFSYCEEKMPAIMASLLPEEVAPPVLSVSTMIAQRGAEEKVDTWLTTYVTCGTVNN